MPSKFFFDLMRGYVRSEFFFDMLCGFDGVLARGTASRHLHGAPLRSPW